MQNSTVITFTRFGMGQAAEELQKALAVKFLSITAQNGDFPRAILFYTDGVKLVCEGSPALDLLRELESKGVRLVICSTCLDFLKLTDKVKVGIVGGMPDIIEAMAKADKVLAL